MLHILNVYSLRPKMIVLISNFGDIKTRSPLSKWWRVVKSMMLKLENNNYYETPPKVAVWKIFLMMTMTLGNILL